MFTQGTIEVQVLSPLEVIFKGQALSLTSKNADGDFDLLPDHTRFMTLIEKVPIEVTLMDSKVKSFTYQSAVLFFEDNVAKIFVHKA